jgi:hypothetical protein
LIEFAEDAKYLHLPLSKAQRVLLKVISGERLTDPAEIAIFQLCTDRQRYIARVYREISVVAGARSGKDAFIATPTVLWHALFGGHEKRLGKGERGLVVLIAQDADAARIAFDYLKDYLQSNPLLDAQVATYMSREILLRNGILIRCFPSTATSVRGRTVVAAVMDEIAYYRLEGQQHSDVEIEAVVNSRLKGPLIKISTPGAKGGVLYRDFSRGFGKDDPDLLVWRASTSLMYPEYSELDRLRRTMDPKRFAVEFEAEFAADIDSFLALDVIEACIMPGVLMLPPLVKDGVKYYIGVDTHGGGADHFTICVCHVDPDGRIVQDLLQGWTSATSLDQIVDEICGICERYNVKRVYGDKYGAGWVEDAFSKRGIRYEPVKWKAPGSDTETMADKSTIAVQCHPLFMTRRLALLDTDLPLVRELSLWERTQHSGGKDAVDHPRGAHDDYATATCTAIFVASGAGNTLPTPFSGALGNITALGSRGGDAFARSFGRPAAGAAGQASHLGNRYGSTSRYARRLGVE